MAVLSSWRKALVTQLATDFPTAEVRGGFRQGVSRDKDRINVFSGGWREQSGRVHVATPVMIVRYWKARSKQPAGDDPADPTELEDAATSLMDALQAVQASLSVTDLWFFRVESVEIDEDPAEWGVEARLVGHGKNTAVLA